MTVHKLIAAPVGLQPGGYIKVAYEGRDKAPTTPSASMDLQTLRRRATASGFSGSARTRSRRPEATRISGSTRAPFWRRRPRAPIGSRWEARPFRSKAPCGERTERTFTRFSPRASEASTASRHRRDGGPRPAGTTVSGASLSISTLGPRSRRTSKSHWPCGGATRRTAAASSRSAKAGSAPSYD